MSRLLSHLALALPLASGLLLAQSCGNQTDRTVTGRLDKAQFRLVDAQAIAVGNGGTTYRAPIQDDGSFQLALPVGHRYTLRFANATSQHRIYDAFAILTYEMGGAKQSWFHVGSGEPLELGIIRRTNTITRGLESEDESDSADDDGDAAETEDVDGDSDADSNSDDLDSDDEADSDNPGGTNDVEAVCDESGGQDLEEVEGDSGLPEDDSDADSDSSSDDTNTVVSGLDSDDGDSHDSADDGDSDGASSDDGDSEGGDDSDADSDGNMDEICGAGENNPNGGSTTPPGEANPTPGGSVDGSGAQPGNL